MTHGPIFIGGLAHSGKTPLRLMLANHANIAMSRRTDLWGQFYGRYGNLAQPENLDRCLTALMNHTPIRALDPDPDQLRHDFQQGAATYTRLFALLHTQHATRLAKPRWGSQLGFIERFADIIFAELPDARMIQMIRDPRDRFDAASAVTRQRKGKLGWSTARWLFSASLTQRNLQRYPTRYKIVRYESLITQPAATLREICTFIGEEYDPALLADVDLTGKETGMAKASAEATTTPPQSRKTLSNSELAFTQAYAGKELATFNYPLHAVDLTFGQQLQFYLIDWPANRATMLAWQALRAPAIGKHLEKT